MTVLPFPRSEKADPRGDPAFDPGTARHSHAWAEPVRVSTHVGTPVPDEAMLIRRLVAGDPNALTIIAEWLWEPLAAYAYRIVGDQDAARDIAQEAFIRLWEGRGRTPPKSLRPYLFRITRNLSLDHTKTRRTRARLLRRHGRERVERPAAPDEVLERDWLSGQLERVIQALPERRREVFVLAYLRGLSYADIADVMEISPKTVQNHMTSALTELRARLTPFIEAWREEQGGVEETRDAVQ